jgi:hypothetical protein
MPMPMNTEEENSIPWYLQIVSVEFPRLASMVQIGLRD